MLYQRVPDKRPPRKIASTTTTNELVDAIASLGQQSPGAVHDDRGRIPPVRVRVKAAAAGGGKYTGCILNHPQTAMSLAGDLADADAGTEAQACAIFNRVERGRSTHALTAAENTVREFEGTIISALADGMPVIEISGYAQKEC